MIVTLIVSLSTPRDSNSASLSTVQTLLTAPRQRYNRCQIDSLRSSCSFVRCVSRSSLEDNYSEADSEASLHQQQPKNIDVFVDADCAARETRLRSTSGVAEYRQSSLDPARRACGHCPLVSLSSTQIMKGSAHSLHSQAILKGFGVSVEAVALSDASAGIGIASRQGCGRLKHLEVKWLWVQEKVSEKALRLKKHPTETNTADLARSICHVLAWNLVQWREGNEW